jgi:hypothetical protein
MLYAEFQLTITQPTTSSGMLIFVPLFDGAPHLERNLVIYAKFQDVSAGVCVERGKGKDERKKEFSASALVLLWAMGLGEGEGDGDLPGPGEGLSGLLFASAPQSLLYSTLKHHPAHNKLSAQTNCTPATLPSQRTKTLFTHNHHHYQRWDVLPGECASTEVIGRTL